MANNRCLLWPAIILPLCMMCAQLTGIVGQDNAVTCTFTNTLSAGNGVYIACDLVVGQNFTEAVPLGAGQFTQFLFDSSVSSIFCDIGWPNGHFSSWFDITPANAQIDIKTNGIFRNGTKVGGWDVAETCTFTNTLSAGNGVNIYCDLKAGREFYVLVPLGPGQSTQLLFNSSVSTTYLDIGWPKGQFSIFLEIAPANAQIDIKTNGIFRNGTKVGVWEIDSTDYPPDQDNAVTCTFTNTLSAGNGVNIHCNWLTGQNYSDLVPLGPGHSTQFLFMSLYSDIYCHILWPKGYSTSSFDIAPANAQIDINTNGIFRNGTKVGSWEFDMSEYPPGTNHASQANIDLLRISLRAVIAVFTGMGLLFL